MIGRGKGAGVGKQAAGKTPHLPSDTLYVMFRGTNSGHDWLSNFDIKSETFAEAAFSGKTALYKDLSYREGKGAFLDPNVRYPQSLMNSEGMIASFLSPTNGHTEHYNVWT